MSVINTNYLALVSQNNLTKSQGALGSAIERLSSGLRINSAKDDAAGQAIANRFTANIKGLTQASRNANDGISIAQTTEGALNEINNNLQRVRELSVQAQNGSNDDTDLKSIQAEITQRLEEIDRVSEQTQFNGKYVLAKDQTLEIQVGANDGQTIKLKLGQIDSKTLELDTFTVAGKEINAKASDLTGKGAVDNGDGTFSFKKGNDFAKMSDVFGKAANGTKVSEDVSGTVTDYTFSSSKNAFEFSNGATQADVATRITDAIEPAGFATGKIKIGADEVDVKIAKDGSLFTADDQKLYLNSAGDLQVTDEGGLLSQTKISDVLTEVDSGGSIATATFALTVEGTSYAYSADFDGGGTEGFTFTDSISAADLQSQISANSTGTTTYAVDLGGLEGSYDLGMDGTAVKTTAGQQVRIDGDSFTLDAQTVTSTYTVTDGVVTDAAGKTVYLDEDGELTTDPVLAEKATENPLDAIDNAIAKVDELRGQLGAVQNRFQSTIANLSNTITNMSAARSRIEDADYAVEVSNMTRAQILQQAGTSVLAQANQVPQGVLSLLR